MIWSRGHVGLEALTSLVETHGPMDQATGFREISISFTFMVPAHPGSPGQRAVKWVCVCVYSNVWNGTQSLLLLLLAIENRSYTTGCWICNYSLLYCCMSAAVYR